jgi:hypothetical protein
LDRSGGSGDDDIVVKAGGGGGGGGGGGFARSIRNCSAAGRNEMDRRFCNPESTHFGPRTKEWFLMFLLLSSSSSWNSSTTAP